MAIKMFEKKGKYRAWSTIVDAYITDWLTLEEMRKYLIRKEVKRIKEDLKTFPYKWMLFPKGRLCLKKS